MRLEGEGQKVKVEEEERVHTQSFCSDRDVKESYLGWGKGCGNPNEIKG